MRVFDTYYFNIIEKADFKSTKPYLEQMLDEQGFSYNNISFMLYNINKETVKKVLDKLPALEKYEFMEDGSGIPDYGVTSIGENWMSGKVHADKEDWEDISVLFSKIPRPYNFSFGKLILDGINWFENSDESIAIMDWDYERDKYPTVHMPPFISNRIMQLRYFDDGKKFNHIFVTIEVTGEDGILNSTPVIQQLEQYLGKADKLDRKCTFCKEEYLKYKDLEKFHCDRLKNLGDSFLPESKEREYTPGVVNIEAAIPYVADKATLNKVFKGTRFERIKGQPNWLHLYSYTDGNGFKYDAYIQKISFGNEFRCWIEISGYNFHVTYRHRDYLVDEEGESSEILKVFVGLCDKLVDEYSEELKIDFGMTPEWYR